MTRLALIALTLVAKTLAAASQDFSATAVESARKAKTDAGDQYGVKFVETSTRFVIEAMRGCDSGDFAIGSTCDFILIISASGRIERVLHGRTSPFAQCIASHLQVPKRVAKPPGDHWPLHVRIFHGHVQEPADPLIMFFADNAKAKR